MQIVRINKKRHAIGLWWQVPASSTAMQAQARALNSSVGGQYTLMALRQGQFGLGKGGWRNVGVPSLAARLAALGASRLCVCYFAQEKCWWVCGIKNGTIAAEGDYIATNKEDALAHAEQLCQILAIETIAVYESSTAIVELLQSSAKMAKGRALGQLLKAVFLSDGKMRRTISPWRSMAILGSAVLVLLLIFMLPSLGLFHDDAAWRSMLDARRQAILKNAGNYFPRPWLTSPTVTAWSARCIDALGHTPFTEMGWDVQEAICANDSLQIRWNFSSTASFLHLPQKAELLTPTSAKKVIAFDSLPPAKDVALQSKDEISRNMYELARVFGLHLTLNWQPKAKKNWVEGTLSVPITAPWHEGTFSIDAVPSMLILDKELYEVLENIPGLVVQSLHFANETWTIKGLCHAL